MKALLSKKYLDKFNMRKCTKEVYDLFDDYNFLKTLIDEHIDLEYRNTEIPSSNTFAKDKNLLKMVKRETLEKNIKVFEDKLKQLKETFTSEELIVFTYSIEQRETDMEVGDKLRKIGKSYYLVKKSCYVKVALKFNLLEKTVSNIIDTVAVNTIG